MNLQDLVKFLNSEQVCINYSFNWFAAGHIILRGWCENLDTSSTTVTSPLNKKESRVAFKAKLKQHGKHVRNACKKENKIILWFEVDDTGCGMCIY